MRFRNFRNKFNKKNRIYSQEDILKMQLSSIFDNENDLIAQNQDIGVPTAEELQNSPNTKWTVPDVGDDGKDDIGYWESIMDELDDTEYPLAPADKPQIILDEDILNEQASPVLEGKVEKSHTSPAPQQQHTVNVEEPYMLEGGVDYENTVPTSYIEKLANKYEGSTLSKIQKAAAKLPIWKSSEKEYYQHALKRADGEEPTDFMKEQNDFKKIQEIDDPNLRQIYVEKAAKMYGLDINDPVTYDAVKNTEVVIPKLDSQLYSQVKNSEVFQKWVAEHYDDIKNQTNTSTSIEFPKSGKNKNAERSLFTTFHNADLLNSTINEDGSFSVLISDGYDFDPINKSTTGIYNSILRGINNNAYEQQELGQLERYLLSTQINLTKEEIDEILKKYNKLKQN